MGVCLLLEEFCGVKNFEENYRLDLECFFFFAGHTRIYIVVNIYCTPSFFHVLLISNHGCIYNFCYLEKKKDAACSR